MPTEQEFQVCWEKHENGSSSIIETLRALRERWPVREDLLAYLAWVGENARQEIKKERTPIYPKEFVDMVATMNYNDLGDRCKLVHEQRKHFVPVIPVGIDSNGIQYRLMPAAYGLRADKNDPLTKHLITESNVLGVNIKAKWPAFASADQPPVSSAHTQPNKSNNQSVGGFVFHQLALLNMPIVTPKILRGQIIHPKTCGFPPDSSS
jgi:hypothetical protein